MYEELLIILLDMKKDMNLVAETIPTSQLDNLMIERIFEIMRSSFEGNFEEEIMKQINNSNTKIIYAKMDSTIIGFHFFSVLDSRIYPESVKGIFAGDLAVDIDNPKAANFLISSVIKEIFKSYIDPYNLKWFWFYPIASYCLFKYLFNCHINFYPNPSGVFPDYEKSILDDFASQCFNEYYDPKTLLISYPHPYWVVEKMDFFTERDLRDPRFHFYKKMNPYSAVGKDLACITELSKDNLSQLSLRLLTNSFG
jgi:hypothetical protein